MGCDRAIASMPIYLTGPTKSDRITDGDRGSIGSLEHIRHLLESCSSIYHFSCRGKRREHYWNLINKKKRFWDCNSLGCIHFSLGICFETVFTRIKIMV